MWRGFCAELVVASPDVLYESVTSDHDKSSLVVFESSHRPKPSFQPAVIALNPIVLMLLGVMKRVRDELLNCCLQRLSQIGDDLIRFAMRGQRSGEESARRCNVTPRGDVDVDDLAMLVNCPVNVTPNTGDFDVGFVNEPPAANSVATRPRRVDQQGREALHPTVDRDVINLDTAFSE